MMKKYWSLFSPLVMSILILIEALNLRGPLTSVLYGMAGVGFLIFLWILVSQIVLARKEDSREHISERDKM